MFFRYRKIENDYHDIAEDTYVEIIEQDNSYFRRAVENIENFEQNLVEKSNSNKIDTPEQDNNTKLKDRGFLKWLHSFGQKH